MSTDSISLNERFNDAARPAAAKRIAAFVAAIRAARPDLAGKEVQVPTKGRIATTVIIGDEVFKTTTDKRRLKELARELSILEIMTENKVPFVPHLAYVAPDRSFFSMKKLPGVTLESVYETMTPDEYMSFAESFGQARAAIDNALAGAQLPESKRFNNRRQFNCTAQALRLWDKPYMQETLAGCDAETRAMLTDYRDRLAAGRNLFCHLDINRGNILVDPETKCVTGLIDLARACQSPFPEPEFQRLFLYLNTGGSHPFVARLYSAYSDALTTGGAAANDVAAYEALHTFGFWHEGSDRKAPDIVKRGIHNCISALPRAKAWLPEKKSP